jgi:CDP-4-dehydro-6-deoxyglucose reductase
MSLLAWQQAVVVDVVQRAEHTRSYFLKVPSLSEFSYTAGQFVSLDLPIHERASQRLRSYSIASTPDKTNVFELLISHKAGGAGSTYLFEQIVTGSELRFRGPLGNFVLPETLDRDICMVCTGTGIAPFRSQIHYLSNNKIPVRSIHLVFGTRWKRDVLYFDELTKLAEDFPAFHYYPTLSRESAHGWNGRRGYVHEVYKELCGHGKKDFDFYLCGWRNMIQDAKKNIIEMGYSTERIHLESYD